MPRDSQTKMSNKETANSKKKEELSKRKKLHQESSDDDESFYTDDDSENELDVIEYRKFLKKMFPSKHLDKKIKSGIRLKQTLKKYQEATLGTKIFLWCLFLFMLVQFLALAFAFARLNYVRSYDVTKDQSEFSPKS